MTRGRVGIVLLCIVLWSPSGVQAQDPQPEGPPPPPITSRRPFRALFGDARAEPELTRGVDFTGSVSRVYDQNLLAELVGVSPGTAFGPSGTYTNLVGDLRFVRRGSRLQVAGTGGVNARYYGNLADFTASDYHVGFGLSARMTPLTTVEVSQALSNSPIFLLGLFATGEPPLLGDARPPATDYAVTNDRAVSGATSVEVERRLSERALVSATGGYRRSHYLAAGPNGSDFFSVDGGGLYRYRIREDSDLQFGYTYRRAGYPGAGPVITGPQPDEHVVLAGLGFHPMSSESRRTVLNFQVGTSLVHLPFATSAFVDRLAVARHRRRVRRAPDWGPPGNWWERSSAQRRSSRDSALRCSRMRIRYPPTDTSTTVRISWRRSRTRTASRRSWAWPCPRSRRRPRPRGSGSRCPPGGPSHPSTCSTPMTSARFHYWCQA